MGDLDMDRVIRLVGDGDGAGRSTARCGSVTTNRGNTSCRDGLQDRWDLGRILPSSVSTVVLAVVSAAVLSFCSSRRLLRERVLGRELAWVLARALALLVSTEISEPERLFS